MSLVRGLLEVEVLESSHSVGLAVTTVAGRLGRDFRGGADDPGRCLFFLNAALLPGLADPPDPLIAEGIPLISALACLVIGAE